MSGDKLPQCEPLVEGDGLRGVLARLAASVEDESDVRARVAAEIQAGASAEEASDRAAVSAALRALAQAEERAQALQEALTQRERERRGGQLLLPTSSVPAVADPAEACGMTEAQLRAAVRAAQQETEGLRRKVKRAQYVTDERRKQRYADALAAEKHAQGVPPRQQQQPLSLSSSSSPRPPPSSQENASSEAHSPAAAAPSKFPVTVITDPGSHVRSGGAARPPRPLHARAIPQPSPQRTPSGSRSTAATTTTSKSDPLAPISYEAYSGGAVLPSLTRATVTRRDIRLRRRRYRDDNSIEAFHQRQAERRRLEMLEAILQYEASLKREEDGVKGEEKGEGDTEVKVKTEAGTERPPAKVKREEEEEEEEGDSDDVVVVDGAAASAAIDVDAFMEEEQGRSDRHVSALLRRVMQLGRSAVKGEGADEHGGKRVRTERRQAQGEGAEAEASVDEQIQLLYDSLPIPPPDETVLSIDLGERQRQRGGGGRAAVFTISTAIYRRLLDYQRDGLEWLLSLHARRTGGILGDEMGLGKTIQIAALLNALEASHQLRGPALVVAPLTVLRQWVAELHRWAPRLRVCVLHESSNKRDGLSAETFRRELLDSVRGRPAVVLATYTALRAHVALLHSTGFQYVIMDEGHKISNSEAAVTLAAKSLVTPHKIIMSGSPIQNSLKELWCLFDFAVPGLLGAQNRFIEEFEAPITASRSSRATPLVLETAVACARALQEAIAPFLLRRLKAQVNIRLPPKQERVVRVPLSDQQLQCYTQVLASPRLQQLLSGLTSFNELNRDFRDASGSLHVWGKEFKLRGMKPNSTGSKIMSKTQMESFFFLHQLRQICNHVDIYRVQRGRSGDDDEEKEYAVGVARKKGGSGGAGGHSMRSNLPVNLQGSAKLQTLMAMLAEWHGGGHKVLVFSQTRLMLDVIENAVEQAHYTYIRMDGTTPSAHRQQLMDKFNGNGGGADDDDDDEEEEEDVFCALLTTRVGGIGVNLVGADRVVIFDPDWNPVTDIQTRERAWRIGQQRSVCIYRLLSLGTVEELVLRRQLGKLYVTNKVLSSPTLQRFFKHETFFEENFLLGGEYQSRLPRSQWHFLASRQIDIGGGGSARRGGGLSAAAAEDEERRNEALLLNNNHAEEERVGAGEEEAGSGSRTAEARKRPRSPGTQPSPSLLHRHHGSEAVLKVEEIELPVVESPSAASGAAGTSASNNSNNNSETQLLARLVDGEDIDAVSGSRQGRVGATRALAQLAARQALERAVGRRK